MIHLVFEKMDASLECFIEQGSCPSNPDLYEDILHQTLKGLEHIHKHQFIHRDIKPDNILCSTNSNGRLSIKVADLGLSKDLNAKPNDNDTCYVGTRWYRAPELLLRHKKYTKAIDIWAFATVAAELANINPLFAGKNGPHQMQLQIRKLGIPSAISIFGEWDLLKCKNFTFCPLNKTQANIIDSEPLSKFTNLLISAFQWDPSKRATASELLNNKIFDQHQTYEFFGPPDDDCELYEYIE